MNEQYKRGERLKHIKRPYWGLGEVFEDQIGDHVRIIFEDDPVLRKFSLSNPEIGTYLVRVVGDEAKSDELTALVKHHTKQTKKKGANPSPAHMSFAQATEQFLSIFPGGFQDEEYLTGKRSEREYKVQAHWFVQENLSPQKVLALADAGDWLAIHKAAVEAMKLTNLIHYYELMWLRNALDTEARQKLFAQELANLLSAGESIQEPFKRFTKMLYDIGVAKWTIATYLPFLAFPDTHIFLKPLVTLHAASVMGKDLGYSPHVSWDTYARLLRLAEAIRAKLIETGKPELAPRDMIDVQSFIWVIGPGYTA